MDQISPPLRIALLAVLAAGALWFTVLRPKASEPAAPAAPGVTGLAKDVAAAKGAAATSDAANAKVQAATGGTVAKTPAKRGAHAAAVGAKARAATATSGVATGDRSASLLKALDRRHAVVLLFWSTRGADDRAVRRAVAAVDRHAGRVVVKTAPVGTVGRYQAITRGAEVLQSPTVLVIAPSKKARSIAGFTTTAELDQAVSDALRSASK